MTEVLQDGDKFLVNRNSESFTVEKQNLMATLDDNDLFLVNRNSESFSVKFETLKADIGGGGGDVEILTAKLSENDPVGDRFTSQKFDFAVTCGENTNVPLTYKLRAYVSGNIVATVETDAITGVNGNTLTFAGSRGLDLLANGDALNQSSAHVVTSSAITNVSGASGNVLTLTDNTDLENFRVDDVVQVVEEWDTREKWSDRLGGDLYQNYGPRVFDTDFTNYLANNGNEAWTTFNPLSTFPQGAAIEVRLQANNDHTVECNGVATSINNDGSYTAINYAYTDGTISMQVRNDNGNNLNWFGIKINGKVLVDQGNTSPAQEYKITSIKNDAAPYQITTDGGTWANGNVVSVNTAAGSGVVGSTDPGNNTLTLSSNDESGTKRWIANQNKIAVGPDKVQPNTKLYLDIDDAQGNITRFPSDVDPGFTQFVSGGTRTENFQLTFPSVFTDGNAPDDDLPVDTSLNVDLQVINANNAAQRLAENFLADQSVTPIEQDGPTATMHGLRFDADRNTALCRSGTIPSTWTFNVWIKPAGANNFKNLLAMNGVDGSGDPNDKYLRLFITGDTVKVGNYNNSNLVTASVVANTWQMVTFSYDGAKLKLGINGATPNENDYVKSFGEPARFVVGGDVGSGALVDAPNAYMSDCYFVGGQVLDGATFGQDFDGKWGPKDSAGVKASVGDFGSDGFFLPFNPAATGVNYSNYFTVPGGWFNNQYNNTKSFDGDTATYANPKENGEDAVFAPPGGIDNITSLEWFGKGKLVVDGVEKYDTGNNPPELVVVTDVASFNQIEIQQTSPGVGSQSFYFKVNGSMLVDHNNIGVDDSGKGNNLHDSSFAVGNAASQQWSDYLFVTDRDGNPSNSSFNTDRGPEKGFDGSMATCAECPKANGLKFVFPPGLSGSVELYNRASVSTLVVRPADGVQQTIDPQQWKDIGTVAELGAHVLLLGFNYNDATNQEGTLTKMIVGGETLIDANIQDTVLDTPMLDYSVLTAGKNGNLIGDSSVTTGAITYTGKVGTNYYLEIDGEGAILQGGGVSGTGDPYVVYPFTATDGKVYNFGQQPFVHQYNASEAWSSVVSVDAWKFSDPSDSSVGMKRLFNGVTTSNNDGLTGGSVSERTILSGFNVAGSTLTIYISGNGSGLISINGGTDESFTNPGPADGASGTRSFSIPSGTLDSISIQCSALYGLAVDGKLLLDGVNNSEVWSDLTVSGSGSIDPSYPVTRLFDGNLATQTRSDTSDTDLTLTLTNTVEYTNSVRIYGSQNGTLQINGQSAVPTTEGGLKWFTVATGSGTLSAITATSQSGSSISINAVEVDGVLLVDPGQGGLAGAVNNELKRTWKEWNGAALLRMSNSRHVAAFNAVEAAIQEYPAKVEQRRDELRGKLRAAGLTAEDITTSFSN